MRYNNIQILRILAALGVIVLHLPVYAARDFNAPDCLSVLAWTGNRMAYPVPLFFAVSGFVLTHALHVAPRRRFLAARFLRLYPGYWLAIVLSTLVAWLTTTPSGISWGARLIWFTHVDFSLAPRSLDK